MYKILFMDILWKPQKSTIRTIQSRNDIKKSYKAFRASSSAYIKKKDVITMVNLKCLGSCVYCGSKDKLQLDHIKSVYFCFKYNLISICNTIGNLQLLCCKCNIIKSHY